jgi:amidase
MARDVPSHLVGESAARLVALVRAGHVTPVEIVQAHLSRIAAVDSRLGAFQRVRVDKALAEAGALASSERLRRLPLAGVPIAIKDNVPVSGEEMRIGSVATTRTPSDADHPAVQRLRAAGAIVIGTTRVSELCIWADCDSAFGTTRNPWNPERTPGGSSGGSAAAVASAMVPAALGADGMGSIRIPAACCGLVGLKPGTGVVPAALGVSAWHGMAENGPMATTVEDVALMLAALAERAEFRDPQPPERPLCIAVSTRPPLPGVKVNEEFAAAALDAGRALAAAGHKIELADPPAASVRSVVAILARWFGGVAQDARALDTSRLERRTRTHVRLGKLVGRFRLVRDQDRAHWRRLHEPFFNRFDLLVTPSLAAPPFTAAHWSQRSWGATLFADARLAPFTSPWNFAGYPAAVVPSGVHSNGLPLSIQLVAAAGGERMILSVAKQLEGLRPWQRHATPP